jgi:serine/threonine protein kinase
LPHTVIPTAAASTTTNEPIPGYKLVKRIGAGGYGEVWTAEAPGELVKAIKFVYGLLDEDRAARELKALNRIKGVRHPFLLSLERIEVVERQLLIVTELAECSLKDRFELCRKAEQPGIAREELLGYMRDAADALDYMTEQHSLQHLDVKPENLLLVGGRIKVADFGLVKDIHDNTASVMGGLTPIYAPPEVFEGRPTRRSDQYSLAIVYQEMLTAVLPFPGRTAAQLAAQHLNAKPRLSSLPEHDQPVIGRALSKKPAERFQSCRELVDALAEAGHQAPGQALPVVSGEATIAGMPTATRLPGEMLANLDAATRAVQQLTSAGNPNATQNRATQNRTSIPRPLRSTQPRATRPTKAGGDAAALRAPELDALQQCPPLVDVPPPDVSPDAPPLRPTLFIGLGGAAGKVLGRLRRRLDDRLPSELKMLAPMLLLDTDIRDLSAAAHGGGLGMLRPEETLALPLRRPQEYREDSRKILEWLSRRWLFNIPRSLHTEGLRPLGRLALVDHAQEATARLKQQIEKLHASATAVQLFPRVVIIASPGGGTGGGMVTDVGFLARQLVEALPEGANMEILAVLLHGTGRNPQQQELAAANTVATLTELAQFHRPGVVFPGDAACGLASRAAGSPAVDAVYLVHAGDELSAADMEMASDRVAEFLALDTISAAGSLLEACRLEQSETPELRLRSFGICPFGFAHDRLLDDSTNRISRMLLQRLSGAAAASEVKKPSRLLAVPDEILAKTVAKSPLEELDYRAATLVRTMGLEPEPLLQLVQQFASVDMGGDPEAFFRKLMVQGPQGQPLVEKWVAATCDLFGRDHSDTSIEAQPGELSQALDARVGPWIAQVGAGLQQWVEAIVDDPPLRVAGARRAAKWFQSYLRTIVDKLAELRGRFQRELAAAAKLLAGDEAPKGKSPRTPQEMTNTFLLYCRLRLFELAAQRAGQIAHALQSYVVASHDGLVELQRELDHLAHEFPTGEDAANGPATDDAEMRKSVTSQLREAEPSLVQQLDDHLTQTLFTDQGGLRAVMTPGGQEREALLTKIRSLARQAALAKVQSIDLASLLLAGQDENSSLAKGITRAAPWLARCGGRRRLVFVLPPQLAGQYTPGTLSAQIGPALFNQLPGVVAGTPSDLVVLFEMGDISVPHAAAHLIDFRRDLAEAAGRLQTRSDVTWTPMFDF